MSRIPASRLTVASEGLSRRTLLTASLATGGGLLLSLKLPFSGWGAASAASPVAVNAFVQIDRDGKVHLTMPYIEMGQSTYTSISMLIAEELEVDLAQVRYEHAPPNDKLYANLFLGFQATGGSTAIRAAWQPMREAGAAARMMLISAAAAHWGVDDASCQAAKGAVIHVPTNRCLSFGDLAEKAAMLPVPDKVRLKDPKEFTLIGKPAKRLDTPAKVNGMAVFGIDAKVPAGMKIATVAACPVFGGKLKSLDDSKAMAVKGVFQVVRLDNAVAVVAQHMGAAKKGLAALDIQWDEGPNATLSTAGIVRQMEAASQKPGAVAHSTGDLDKAMAGAKTKLDAIYQLPFLAHTTMEPINCTAHVRKDSCEVWVGTQVMTRAQSVAASITGLPHERVTVRNHLLGGGFGRRLEVDFIAQAVKIAMHVDGPVKVIWTREEDIQHDMYRPSFFDRITAGLDTEGMPVAWNHRITGSSIIARWAPPVFKNGFDIHTIDGAEPPYDLPNMLLDYARYEPPGIPTAFWRSVGASHNIFVVESFIDELAAAAKKDPVAYRLGLLKGSPRARAVLQLAAEKSEWGQPLPDRTGRGASVQTVFGTFMAQVAQVNVSTEGEVRVERVVCAVDCGIAINPDTIKAQIQGAIIYGLTAALYGEITVKNGRVEQANFDSYPALRMNEVPEIDVHIVDSAEAPGGMGEPGTSALPPAVTNAIFAATGKRLRKLPIDTSVLK